MLPDVSAFEHDGRVAKALLMCDGRFAGGLRRLLHDLAEDVRLGEALRADIERCRERGCCARREHRDADGQAGQDVHASVHGGNL